MISQNKFDGINAYWINMYNSYQKNLDDFLSNDTKDWRLKNIRGFLRYATSNKIYCSILKPIDVYNYLSSLENYSHRTREHRAICIRFFLNFLYNNSFIKFSGNKILQHIHCNKESKIISYYSNKEISKLLKSIKTKDYDGKLNYALISLIVYYGLRQKDVINLKTKDIDWKNNVIIVNQSKNNYINVLPIIDDIKYPLLDYINVKKNKKSDFLFLNQNNEQINEKYIYNVINKYLILANININNRRHGAHSLRHSLGTSMINDNDNIYTISKILGHKNINDTKIYTKLDFTKLKKISLEVPKWNH